MDINPLIHHRPDPDHPGWWTWDIRAAPPERFNFVIGKLLVRPDGPGRATVRMFPEERHSNLGNMVHGGAILTFIDMAFFAGGRVAGADIFRAVTLDCSVRFLSPGRIGIPMDAEVELLRETKRLAIFTGRVVQEAELVAHFTGTLRKSARPVPQSSPSSLGDAQTSLSGGQGGLSMDHAQHGGGATDESPTK